MKYLSTVSQNKSSAKLIWGNLSKTIEDIKGIITIGNILWSMFENGLLIWKLTCNDVNLCN